MMHDGLLLEGSWGGTGGRGGWGIKASAEAK